MKIGGSNVNFGASSGSRWNHGGSGDYGSGGLHSSAYLGGDAVSRMLLANYTFRHRPVLNTSNPIVVEVMLTVIQLITLHEKQQEMATKVWLDQYWTDEYLVWDAEELNGIQWMTFRSNEIWVPDIAIDNSIKYEREDMDIKVDCNGGVWWSMPAVVRTSCNIDTKKFPFDTQTCTITLGSWYHDPTELDLRVAGDESTMKTEYFMHNAQWDVVSSSIHVLDEVHVDYDMTFRTVHFSLSFKRKSLYFLLILIVPFIMISTVSLSNFVLPCESGEKISLGITVLLSLFVNLLNLVDLLPESSDSFPILGSYYLISMGLVASSVVMTVIVLNIHHQPIKSRRLHRQLREGVFFLFVARILCVGRPVKTPAKFAKMTRQAYQMSPTLMNGTSVHSRLSKSATVEFRNSGSSLRPTTPVINRKDVIPLLARPRGPESNNNPQCNTLRHKLGAGGGGGGGPTCEEEEMLKVVHILQQIKDRLTREQTKDLEKEYQKYIKEEWRYLARVVDRLLGLLYVTTFVTLIFAFS